ncbi:AmmeMemoRadiSam system radical SAM enzyme [Raineyella fluvialis]|uniref:AmmeMemoRadiSam system radical SAM enzyme n=1 Tax=Raineyella fluvialis TaxID=2662261 RepID=A0A5Q2F9S1_9ACTN|nr:AmmeMemoRadiSam system radical SAM enzyme [Raineyella fluvialis]QGF23438.1 AmmeMemoRadiSam system radical SAM enzyme [Raineyella fluvialis]
MPGESFPARWWHPAEDGRLVCDVCPRACALTDGQAGICTVRAREGDKLVLTTYGRGAGFCIDAVERRPLYHFLPGSAGLCLGTAGCNLNCRTCRVWRPETVAQVTGLLEDASPLAVAGLAADWRCASVAFTYNDPVIYAEYAIAVARVAHVLGLRTIAVTAGYMERAVRRDFFGMMDAALIELKVFDAEAHLRYAGGDLQTVLDTLVHVRHSRTWLEMSTLLVPGLNDDPAQLWAMCTWIRAELGPDVPLHFSTLGTSQRRPAPGPAGRSGTGAASHGVPAARTHPASPTRQTPRAPQTRPTPQTPTPQTPPDDRAHLVMAREIALECGLNYVYTGLADVPEGRTTHCPSCRAVLIERDAVIRRYRLTSEGRCPECRAPVPGVFADRAGESGARKIPVRVT